MNENSNLTYTLAVEAKDSYGRIKDARYITKGKTSTVEFIPNRIYLFLLNRGIIASETWKVPFLLGSRKKEK